MISIMLTPMVARRAASAKETLIVRDGGPHDFYIMAGSQRAKRAFVTKYYEFQERVGTVLEICIESTLNDEYNRFADFGACEYAMRNCGFPVKIIVDSREELEATHKIRYRYSPWRHVRVNVAKNTIAEVPGDGIEAWREIEHWTETPRQFSEKYPPAGMVTHLGIRGRWDGEGGPITESRVSGCRS